MSSNDLNIFLSVNPCRQAGIRTTTIQVTMLVLVVLLSLGCIRAQIFSLPDSQACNYRAIHAENIGKSFHFSWLATGKDTMWEGGGKDTAGY